MKAADVLPDAVRRLSAAGVGDPPGDARRLLAHALGVAPDRLLLALHDPLPDAARSRFEAALDARAARQPVSQIVGGRMFWGRWFEVTRDVLDPRPETETLVAAALERPFKRVLDAGVGSAAILGTLLAERPQATGLGVDNAPSALAVAARNLAALGVGERAELRVSDWFTRVCGRFDLITANPPYIAAADLAGLAPEVRDWEPAGALTPAGDGPADDGLGAIRVLAAGACAHLTAGGWLLVEIGAGQAAAAAALVEAAGFDAVSLRRDFDGRDRVVMAQRP